MVERMVVWGVFVLVVLVAAWVKPHATRVFLGFFFIVMAVGFHIVLVLRDPHAYDGYAVTALLPVYRWIFRTVVMPHALVFAFAAAAFEITIALLMLSKGRAAKLGLVAGSVFLLAITPLGRETLPNALLAVVLAYLATKQFPANVLESVRATWHRHAPHLVS
jgi:hypothetical protein